MKSMRQITTSSNILPELIKLNLNRKGQMIVFNYWKPGFYQLQEKKRLFYPTDSLLEAVTKGNTAIFSAKGQQPEHKDLLYAVHPGHVSLEVVSHLKKLPSSYLSIGTEDALNFRNVSSPCKMTASDAFEEDCHGLRRFPDVRLPFFSLDTKKAKLATMKILQGVDKNAYSLLGEIGDSQGKNCATAVYFALLASGIRTLIDLNPSSVEIISEMMGTKICVPETLAVTVQKAYEIEKKYAKSDKLYENFSTQSRNKQENFVKAVRLLEEANEVAPEPEDNNKPDNKP